MHITSSLTRSLTRVATVAAATLATIAVTSPTQAAPPPGDVLQCGSVVTTDVRLTRDLVDCPGDGLVVGADGVTVDLGGHRVDGSGGFVSRSGVFIDAYNDVTVRNGRISDFGYAVDAYAADGTTLRGLVVRRTLEGLTVQDSRDVAISHSTLVGNRQAGTLRGVEGARVTHTVARDNTTSGLSVIGSREVDIAWNRFVRNAFDGLSLETVDASVVTANLFAGNGLDGVNAADSGSVTYRHNLAVRNDDHGINDEGDEVRWRANAAYRNGTIGLRASEAATDAGGNHARGNGEADCVGLTCR